MAVSDADLERARRVAAEIVDRMGDAFWPVFERIDDEYKHRLERAQRVAACLRAPPSERARHHPR